MVSIVILTKNGMPYIKDCLESVFNQRFTGDFEVICIDSGSTDGTLNIIKQYPVRFFNISPHDFNHGLTRNLAIDRAYSEFVVLLTQDAIPYKKDWLNSLIDNFNDESVAGVYCRQIPREEDDLILKKEVNNFLTARKNKIVSYIEDRKYHDNFSPIERFLICYFDNVCSCIRKSVWEKINFPKTDFAEDLMWSKKVLESGHKIVYEPKAVVIHSHNRSLKYMYQRNYIHYKTLNELFNIQEMDSLSIAVKEALKQSYNNIVYTFNNRKQLTLSSLIRTYLKWSLAPLIKNYAQYQAIRNSIINSLKVKS